MSIVAANLLVRLTKLGDLINATPVFRAFKETYPDQPLHLLTDDSVSTIIENDPHIDRIIRIPWRDRYRGMRPSWLSIYSTVKKNGPYERAAILEANVNGLNWVMALLGIKHVAQIGGTASALILRHEYVLRGDHKDGRHISEQLLDVARKLGATTSDPFPKLYVTDEERAAVLKKFPFLREPNTMLVHPFGATSLSNLTPQSYFELSRFIADNTPYRIYFVGTHKEIQEVSLPAHPKISLELAGKTTMRELMAICSHADFVLGGSSGIVHIAAAMGAATLGLFCPYGNNHLAWGGRGPWAKNISSPPHLCRRLGATSGPCQFPKVCDNAFGFPPELVLTEMQALIDAKREGHPPHISTSREYP